MVPSNAARPARVPVVVATARTRSPTFVPVAVQAPAPLWPVKWTVRNAARARFLTPTASSAILTFVTASVANAVASTAPAANDADVTLPVAGVPVVLAGAVR